MNKKCSSMCLLLICEENVPKSVHSRRRLNKTFQFLCLCVPYCVSFQGTNTFYMALSKRHLFHILSNGTLDHFLFSGMSYTGGNSTLSPNGSTQQPHMETLKQSHCSQPEIRIYSGPINTHFITSKTI